MVKKHIMLLSLLKRVSALLREIIRRWGSEPHLVVDTEGVLHYILAAVDIQMSVK
jgi:hypothetical protein